MLSRCYECNMPESATRPQLETVCAVVDHRQPLPQVEAEGFEEGVKQGGRNKAVMGQEDGWIRPRNTMSMTAIMPAGCICGPNLPSQVYTVLLVQVQLDPWGQQSCTPWTGLPYVSEHQDCPLFWRFCSYSDKFDNGVLSQFCRKNYGNPTLTGLSLFSDISFTY